MKHQELNWQAHDGINLFAQVWEPKVVESRGVVCLVHGLGEHSGRYAHVAEAFTKEGFILIGYDHRGHGRSGGIRGHINSIDDISQDIHHLLQQARLHFPGLPLLLYGHSLGGILTLNFVLKFKPDLKGVIITSPGLRNALEKQTFKLFLVNLLGSLLPAVTLPSGLDAKDISRDQSVVDAYLKDPLVHDRLSLGFAKIMLGVIKWTLENIGNFPLPLLLLHGKSDRIAFPASSIEVDAALKDRSTLVLWEEGYHELHNEPEKAEVFKTMTMWMDARLREAQPE